MKLSTQSSVLVSGGEGILPSLFLSPTTLYERDTRNLGLSSVIYHLYILFQSQRSWVDLRNPALPGGPLSTEQGLLPALATPLCKVLEV